MKSFSEIKDSIEVSTINGGAVLISMSEVEQTLRILSLVFAVAYTGCRLFNLWKDNKKK
jgi:hypothetical protein